MNLTADVQKVQHLLLNEALAKGIQKNEEQCKIWTNYKKGHEKVAEALQTFQKDLYVNCMVPIGRRALMKGKLIHTNEVLACLGDGYFAKYSASGAVALCQRRIEKADEMLMKLSKERDLYETRMMVAETNLFEDLAGKEIVEHWNEDQIAAWKKKHREKEREYHQKLAKLRQEEKKKIETEEDLFNRLDQLEIEEELADELNRLEDEKYNDLFRDELENEEWYYESEEESEEDSEEDSEEKGIEEKDSNEKEKQVSDSDKAQPEETVKKCKMKKSVSFAEPEDALNKVAEELTKEQKESIKNTEDTEEEIVRIEFVHSKNNSVAKSDGDSIETPADIYRVFSKPMSILKRSPNDVNPEQVAPPEYSTEEEEEEEEEGGVKSSTYEIVVKDIKEKDVATAANVVPEKKVESEDTRHISKFKRDRQLRQ
ncbi:unconventional prefoldin RPB5 interactor [Xylocopa sonorina]|uniref:unconventional prefoldin RPB5 interactor n=1 Tax=Xylocopa sonorina TaxID=1818115 RepID=UPI00403B0599